MNLFAIFSMTWQDAIDITICATIIYFLLRLIRGTRGFYMLTGLLICVLVYSLSKYFSFRTLDWMLGNFFNVLLILIVVVFQHDIRRILTKMGRSPFFAPTESLGDFKSLEEIIRTAVSLANKKIGALIVVEKTASVADYVEQGLPLDAMVSKDLITTIFLPVSPIHDGAIVVQRDRIIAAGCLLPLSMNPGLAKTLGTRHRAGIGLTEETDAVVVIVSEETGTISLAVSGEIEENLDAGKLRERLHAIFSPPKRNLVSLVKERLAKQDLPDDPEKSIA